MKRLCARLWLSLWYGYCWRCGRLKTRPYWSYPDSICETCFFHRQSKKDRREQQLLKIAEWEYHGEKDKS